jgi:hypothetical protein
MPRTVASVQRRLEQLETLTERAINATLRAPLPIQTKTHYNILICGISKGLTAASVEEAHRIFIQTYTAVATVDEELIDLLRQYLEDAIQQYSLARRHNVPLHNSKAELLFCINQIALVCEDMAK